MTGAWTDVFVLPDGRLGQVAVDGASVSCEVEGIPTWTQKAPIPVGFCRCAVHQGLVLTIHQGNKEGDPLDGRAFLIGSGIVRDLGLTFGVQPVAIDSQYAYVVRVGAVYDRINLETAEAQTFPFPPNLPPDSGQGISDIAENGAIWWADLHRSIVISGTTLTYPNVRGPVTVGQADPPSLVAAVNGIVKPVVPGDGWEPHVVVSGTRAAVCARTPHSATYVVLDLPVFTRVPGPIVKKKEPMEAKPLPADVHAIAVELHARNLALAHGSDDDRRALQKKICETVRARKGPSWGWKSNHLIPGDGDNAKDAIAQLPDGATVTPNERQPLYIWDLFNGTTRQPNPLPLLSGPEHESAQYFVPVQPIDHLGAVQPDPVKPPPGDKPLDLAPFIARIDALEAAQLRQRVEALEAAHAKDHAYLVDLADVVERLDARPAFDLATALQGYEVSGSTSAKGSGPFGHAHTVKLPITRKA